MEKIYWISVIGNIQILLFVIAILSAVLLLFFIIWNATDDEEKIKVKYMITTILIVVFTSLSLIFIPTEKQMYAIYGIGGTIDYIENNDKAKELPNKVIDALDLYLDREVKQ